MTGNSIRGVMAAIKWSYYNAAAIEGYTVTRNRQTAGWTLRARVVQADAFKLKQQPLIFVAPYVNQKTKQSGVWRWTIDGVDIQNGIATAKLGRLLP